jgi:pimeloyl-ACP methyl ester carboxylesterase
MAAHAIAMPRLGMTMEEGTVVDWPVAPGGRVERGAVVLVIENEKNESEIEATVSGTLRHVYVEPGETVPCGALLAAVTDTPDEDFDADDFAAGYTSPTGPARSAGAAAPGGGEQAGASSASARSAAAGADARRRDAARGPRKPVAPAARALARKLGVDPNAVEGTGPNGRVTRADVESFVAAGREGLVEVEPGVGLEVLRTGEGEAVVLLPGLGTDAAAFALLTPHLAGHYAVAAVNPRGVGRSDAPDAPAYPVARAADDVAAVIDAVSDGPAHVVGASLGAAVAMELALRDPGKVRSLALVTPFLEAGPRLLAFARAWQRAAEAAPPEAVATILAPWLFGERLLADDAARERTLRGLVQTLRRVPPATIARQAEGLRAWSGTRGAAVGDLSVPTLVLSAEEDLLTPDGHAVAAAIPGAEHVAVAGCGHALAIDDADTAVKHLLAHLDRASRAG